MAKPNFIVASDNTQFKVTKFVPEISCFRLKKDQQHPSVNSYLIRENVFAQVDFTANTVQERFNLKSNVHSMYLEWYNKTQGTGLQIVKEKSLGVDLARLGKLIRETREAHGIKVSDFAKDYGLSANYFSRVERNEVPQSDNFPGSLLIALYKKGISVDKLLFNTMYPDQATPQTRNEQIEALIPLLHLLSPEILGTIYQLVNSQVRTMEMDEKSNNGLVAHMDVNKTGTKQS